MKFKKYSASEFFYDKSFKDYKPFKESLLKREFRIFKRFFDWKYFIKFLAFYNFLIWWFSSVEKYNINNVLFANGFVLAFTLFAYYDMRKRKNN